MTFQLTNDELFVLCTIGGCTETLGVANNFIAMDEAEVYAQSKNIIEHLERDGYVQKDADKFVLNDSVKEIVGFISAPDETYIISDGESEEYLFFKDKSMYMKNVDFENCYIDIFDDQDKMKSFFKSRFDFFKAHTDSVQYMLSIPSDIMDKAIGKAEDGKFDEAIEILDGDDFEKDEIMNMLKSIVFPDLSKIVISRKNKGERSSESIYKICGTDKGAWIVRISTSDEGANTLIYKATDNDITKVFFEV